MLGLGSDLQRELILTRKHFPTVPTDDGWQALFELQSQHIVPSVSMTIDQQNPCIEELLGHSS